MKKIYMFLFLISCCCYHVTADNSTCGNAVPISEGSGVQPVDFVKGQREYWYFYTAPSDRDMLMVVQVPTRVNGYIYSSCEGDPEDFAYGGELQAGISKGSVCYICFKQSVYEETPFSEFGFTIKEVVLGGATCADAFELKDGENVIPFNRSGSSGYETWVRYTATGGGKLTISFPNESYLLSIYRYAACDVTEGVRISASNNAYQMIVGEDETVLLKFANQSFMDAIVSCYPVERGDDCENPLTAVTGDQNFCKATKAGNHWYSFTPGQDGFMEVSACGMEEDFGGKVSVFETCDGYARATADGCPVGKGFYLRYEVTAGRTYLVNINLATAMSTDFGFSVNVADYRVGDKCDMPLTAFRGNNSCEGISGSYWYSYTVTEPSYLTLSDNKAFGSNGNFYLYRDCNSYYVASGRRDWVTNEYTLTYKADPGTYLIKIELTAKCAPFDFVFNAIPIEKGDECSNPLDAVAGNNPCSGKTGNIWYRYEASKDGYLEITTVGVSDDFNGSFDIYKDCNVYSSPLVSSTPVEGGGVFSRLKMNEGEVYLIKWIFPVTYSPFGFHITETDSEPGEACSNPLQAVAGDNPFPSESTSTYFSYIPEKDGWMNISVCSPEWSFLSGNLIVQEECESASLTVLTNDCPGGGTVYKTEVSAGVPYVICITGRKIFTTDMSFTLAIEDYATGDVCAEPLDVADISGPVPVERNMGSIWYRFVADKDGFYTVSSSTLPGGLIIGGNPSSIKVKTGDCGREAISSSIISGTHTVTVAVEAGTPVYVNIYIHKTTEHVNWNVAYRAPEEGETCFHPIRVTIGREGASFVCPVGEQIIWYGITSVEDGRVTVSACGKEGDVVPELVFYMTCDGEPLVMTSSGCADGAGTTVELENVSKETVYMLKLTGYFSEPTPVEMVWQPTVSIGDEKEGTENPLVTPNPNDGTFSVNAAFFDRRRLSIEINDMQGKVVYRNEITGGTEHTIIYASGVFPGLYFIKVTDGDKTVIQKFMIR